MSSAIEERVAALKFDNSQFEKNVAISISTLEKLKKALDFGNTGKVFRDIETAAGRLTFYGMANSLKEIENRFSTFGIVGMTVIQDLTRAVENLTIGALTGLFNKIKEGGKARAFNIENAHFLLQGLYNDAKEIKAIEDDAMESVSDTAYGYDEAIKTAAQLAASGVQSGKDMQSVLAAIAGVAATTSSRYIDIADIFRDVAGRGKAMAGELSRISGYGINAANVLSKYFNAINDGSKEADESITNTIKTITGGAKVTEAEVMDMASKSKISFELFAAAMSDSFGKHAKEANKTIVGVLSNINARFSQIGAKFFSPLIEQEGPLNIFLNKVMTKLTEVRNKIDPIADLFTSTVIRILDIGGELIDKIPVNDIFDKVNKYVEFLSTKINSIFGTVDKIRKPVGAITKESIDSLGLSENALVNFQNVLTKVAKEHNIDIDSMVKSENSFWDSLKNGWLTTDLYKEAVDRLTDGNEEVAESFDELREAAQAVIRGDYGNDAERIAALTEAGFDPQKVQDFVNKIHELTGGTWQLNDAVIEAAAAELGFSSNIEEVSDKELEAIGYTEEEIEALRKVGEEAEKSTSPLTAFKDIVHDIKEAADLLIDSAKNIGNLIWEIGDVVKNAFVDVFPDIDLSKFKIPNLLELLTDFNKFTKELKISDDTKEKLSNIFRGIFTVVKTTIDAIEFLVTTVLPRLIPVLITIFDFLIDKASEIGKKVTEFADAFSISDDTVDKLKRTLNGILALGSIVFGFLSVLISNLIGPFIAVLTYVFDFILDKTALLGDILVELDKKIKATSFFQSIADTIINVLSMLKIPKSVTEFFDNLVKISDVSKYIDFSSISKLFESLLSIFENFIDKFVNIDTVAALAAAYLMYKFIKFLGSIIVNVATLPKKLMNIIGGIGDVLNSASGMFKKIGDMSKKIGIAALVASIAFAFGSLANAVVALSTIDASATKRAIVLTALVAGAIIGVYAAIASMDAKAKIRPSLESIAFILVVSKAFRDIAKAMAELKDFKGKDLIAPFLALNLTLVVMYGIAVTLGNLESSLSLSALLFPITYAKGLRDISKALAGLKGFSGEGLLQAFAAINASLLFMAVIAVVLSGLESKLSLSALLFPITYAKGLRDISKALAGLKGFKGKELIAAFLAINLTLIVMYGIAETLSNLETSLSLSALLFPITYAKGLRDISKALAGLKGFSGEGLLQAFAAINASLLFMAVIAVVLSGLESKLSLSALLFPITYAKGLRDISKALAGLKGFSGEGLLQAFIAINASLLIMAVIAVVLSGLESKLSLSALLFPILYAKGLKDISRALAGLKDFKGTDLIGPFLALNLTLIVMYGIAETLSGLESKLSLSALLFPILYAKGLKDISKALAGLKGFSDEGLLQAFIALNGSLVIMAIIAVVLSGLKSKIDMSALAVPIAFAGGLLLLALAIRTVGTMAGDDLKQGLEAILVSMIVLAGIIAIMANFSGQLEKVAESFLRFAVSAVAIAIGFAIVSVGLIALGYAIKMFEGISIEQVGVALFALAGAMAILVIAANALCALKVGLIFLGTAFLMIAVAAYVLVEALVLLSNNFDAISEVMPKVGAAIVNGIVSALQGLLNFIISYLPIIGLAGLAIVAALGSGITIGIPLFPIVIGAVLLAGLKFIIEHWDMFAEAGLNIVKGLGAGIASGAEWVKNQAMGLGAKALQGIKNFLGIKSPSTVMALVGLMFDDGFGKGITKGTPLATNAATALGSDTKSSLFGELFSDGKIEEAGFNLDSILANSISSNKGQTADAVEEMTIAGYDQLVEQYGEDGAAAAIGAEMPKGIANNIDANADDILNSITSFSDLSNDELMKEFGADGDLAALGLELPEGLSSNIDLNSFAVTDSIGSMLTDAEEPIDNAHWEDKGANLVTRLAEGIEFSGDLVKDAVSGVVEDGTIVIEEAAESLTNVGESISEGLISAVVSALGFLKTATINDWISAGRYLANSMATGISGATSKIKTVAKELSNRGASAARTTKSSWIDVGEALSDGLAQGVRNHSSKVTDAAKSAAKNAYNAAKNALGVKSPSKVFAELGKFVDLGLAKGIYDNEGYIKTSAESMINRLVSGSKNALSYVNELINSNIIDDPVIKPVLDLSEIQNGSNRLYSMMSDMDRYSLHGNIELATGTALSVDRERQSRTDRDDDMLTALIDGLKELRKQNDEPRGNTYVIDGITYDDGSNVANAIGALIRAAKVGGRA